MYMSGESLLIILVVGVIAGWLSGQIVQGTGFGIVGDLLMGIVGTFIGATFGALVAEADGERVGRDAGSRPLGAQHACRMAR
jgi:uncharacterized membrane protein YeaQ/YmgE (transglycosylase-associated protein family)